MYSYIRFIQFTLFLSEWRWSPFVSRFLSYTVHILDVNCFLVVIAFEVGSRYLKRTGKAYQWKLCPRLSFLYPRWIKSFLMKKSPLYSPKPNPKLTFLAKGEVCNFSPLLSPCWTDRGALEKVLILQPFWWACWPVGAASCRDQSPLGSLSCH